jgi:hypothetical protein
MLRLLILAGLVVAAVVLVRALMRDHGDRQRDRLAGLRAAFLHGSPLGIDARPPGLRATTYRGIVSFHVPGSWIEEPTPAGGAEYFDASRTWTLRLELLSLQRESPVDAAALASTLGDLKPRLERTVEVLSSGLVLMKCLDGAREEGKELLLYSWRLGQPLPEGRARVALFALSVPATRAEDVLLRADLTTLEREIRAATFAG